MLIAVNGVRTWLPKEFPESVAENSGNMIHGNVPRWLFGEAYHALDRRWQVEHPEMPFKEFVNEHCSHVIFTMANFFRLGDHSPNIIKRYTKFTEAIQGIKKPIVIFGLGTQAKTSRFELSMLPAEAIKCLKEIADHASGISVRGDFTRNVLESILGPGTVTVTGCPSYYSNAVGFEQLHKKYSTPTEGHQTGAVHITNYGNEDQTALLEAAITKDHFLVEPANAQVHAFHREVMKTPEIANVPKELTGLLTPNGNLTRETLVNFFRSKYRLFRQVEPWLDFNKEFVDFTVGTRFHVGMASILAGVPSVLLTHDSRTSELGETLSLPRMSMPEATKMSPDEIFAHASFKSFFTEMQGNFENFNRFLTEAGLPPAPIPMLNQP